MAINVEISSIFRSYLDGQKSVTAEGRTVGECLKYISDRYPSTKDMFIDDEGNLMKHFDVYLNGESIFPNGSETPVKYGDKMDLIYIIHGG